MFKILLTCIVFLNFFALGSSRMRAIIRTAGLQGAILGLLTLVAHEHIGSRQIIVAALTFAIKGVVIPSLLFRAIREAHIRREVEPLLGFVPSLLFGGLGTALAVLFAGRLPLDGGTADAYFVSTAFSTILTGFILIIARHKAITQVVGYLILENGIFVFGLLLIEAMPFFVEMGVLLDVFVGVFIMGIIINRIQRTFSSLDTVHLERLKD
ncbi:MAG: hydrogenase [Candidatus Hydrogenedentes bacterium]|nr:hydrogenase [Candidatus Hydrogenedentota bacterium]